MTGVNGAVQPRIARIWRGRTTADRADAYERHLLEAGHPPLVENALAVEQLRKDRDGESEFITISYWESVEAMSRFAGADPRRIHHLPRDEEFLIDLPKSVQMLRIVAGAWPKSAPSQYPGEHCHNIAA